MIGQECIDELADFAGLKAHVAEITERAMRGEIEFEPALRERVALLKGMPVGVVDEVLAKRITPTPGGRELVTTMRAHGAYTCLISGGFTLFTNAVAAKIGFQENRANELVVRDGKFTGEVKEPILGRAAKLATLIELRESLRPRRHRHPGRRRWRQRPRHDPDRRDSASPITPSPRSPPPPRRGSITATSPRCSMRRGIGARSLWRTESHDVVTRACGRPMYSATATFTIENSAAHGYPAFAGMTASD